MPGAHRQARSGRRRSARRRIPGRRAVGRPGSSRRGTTLTSCGSSSILSPRSNAPSRVIRSVVATWSPWWPAPPRMVRILSTSKVTAAPPHACLPEHAVLAGVDRGRHPGNRDHRRRDEEPPASPRPGRSLASPPPGVGTVRQPASYPSLCRVGRARAPSRSRASSDSAARPLPMLLAYTFATADASKAVRSLEEVQDRAQSRLRAAREVLVRDVVDLAATTTRPDRVRSSRRSCCHWSRQISSSGRVAPSARPGRRSSAPTTSAYPAASVLAVAPEPSGDEAPCRSRPGRSAGRTVPSPPCSGRPTGRSSVRSPRRRVETVPGDEDDSARRGRTGRTNSTRREFAQVFSTTEPAS